MTEDLAAALRRPEAYPWPAAEVGFLQTHISWLFFAGREVLKVKKPLRLDFLDYGTLERRRHFCREEVRLNRRLAPEVYRGVVPIARAGEGLRVEGDGEVVEWAVRMRRLPEGRMLSRLLESGDLPEERLRDLIGVLVEFHQRAATGEGVDEHGSPAAIRRKVAGNLEELSGAAPDWMPAALVGHLRRRSEEFLEEQQEVLQRRWRTGRIREGHGDLHAGNICLEREGVVIYDCIEFSRELRCGDVASDLGFLAMDLDARGEAALSDELAVAYAARAGDPGLVQLLPFYKTYRAAVRAKVATLAAGSGDLPADETREKEAEALGYLALAVATTRPPALILTCGLPGTGKSWLARRLQGPLRAGRTRSDAVRKALAGVETGADRPQVLYRPEMTRRTYRRLRERAGEILDTGRSALVDATFSTRELRRPFLALARERGCPVLVLHVTASEATVRRRLERRDQEEALSDADLEVYRKARRSFQPPAEVPAGSLLEVASGRESPGATACRVLERMIG